MELKILVSGIASIWEARLIRAGKISPATVDLGFLMSLNLFATWSVERTGRSRSRAVGMSPSFNPSNSALIALKCEASVSATVQSNCPGWAGI